MQELLTMLDTKYKRLEYIQSTGTQYINTGITRNSLNKWRFKGVVNFQNVTTRQIMGVGGFVYFGCVNGYWQIAQTGTNHTTKTITLNTYNNFDIEINATNNTYNAIIDNENISGSTGTQASDNLNIWLFRTNTGLVNTYPCSCKLKYLQIYKDDTLVRNFVPVLRKSDNEIGMLDTVEGKFYPNAGTGKFTANLDTMYALIQGTPTVQDGRVSGFSDTNYLKLDSANVLSQANSWEIICKFTTKNVNITQGIIGLSPKHSLAVFATNDSFLKIFLSSNGTSWDIVNENIMGISANTLYTIKIEFTGNAYNIYSYENNNWVIKKNIPTTDKIYSTQFLNFGVGRTLTQPFLGTIDLNRSYIKIDDTKYKLQAVVGYTKVGTPTITDGVVSGFSSSNYLNIDKSISFERIEMQVAFTLNGSSSHHQTICENAFFPILFTSYGYIATWNYNTSSWNIIIPSNKIISNGYYKIKVISKNNDLYVSYSINNTDFIYSMTFNNIHKYSARFLFGANPNFSERVFLGSIDMNNTYIKINNKLWFNGLPQ